MFTFLLFLTPVFCEVTKTVLGFSRKLDTCDTQDNPFLNSTTKIAWSYNDNDPVDESNIPQHQYQGTASVRFFSPDNSHVPIPPGASHFDVVESGSEITFDDPVTGPTTSYWCSSHKIDLGSKQHVIRVDPVIDPNYVGQVHHLIVYQCSGALNDVDLAYHGSCFAEDVPSGVNACQEDSMVHVWAVGGTSFIYPENVGLPVGPETTYYVLQTHYNNPTQIEIKDHSGVRFYYTDDLRQYDAGTTFMGHPTMSIFQLPPGMSDTRLTAYCPSQCTQKHFPETGIQIIAVGLHTHVAGKSIYLQHFRNGTELQPPVSEPYYDFNYQDFSTFSPFLTVYPGDEFKLTCVYDTTDRTAPTPMGLGTQQEMCLVYYVYYPRLPPANEGCYSANFSGIENQMNWTSTIGLCSREDFMENWEPMNAIPYESPSCVYQNVTSPLFINTTLNLSSFERSQYLDDAKKYKIYWTVDKENGIINGAVEVETTGWVGFGITSYGMVGADVFIGWVKDGAVYFADRFALAHSLPPVDVLQDYFYIYGSEVTTSDEKSSSGLSGKETAGIIIGVFFGVVLFTGLLICLCRKRNTTNTAYYDFDKTQVTSDDRTTEITKHSETA